MTDRKQERRGLGRGLSALMADINVGPDQDTARRPEGRLPVESLRPNPNQPRRDFPASAMEDLAASIRQKGVLQPLIVRPAAGPGTYEIVAGERRWRAAQLAGLHDVPVVIRDFDDTEVLEVAIIENIQRADLNAIEEAAGYRVLMDRFGHTQERLAEAMAKSRSHIANLLRLLTLPETVQTDVREGRLSAGHARALVTASDPVALARQVIARNLSVRETEALVRPHDKKPRSDDRPGPKPTEKDADTRALEADLSAALGMNVTIDHSPGGESGALTVRYATLDDLDSLCRILSLGAD
jgi:ParB family transcriptional regulator, chromosome partitioning protein